MRLLLTLAIALLAEACLLMGSAPPAAGAEPSERIVQAIVDEWEAELAEAKARIASAEADIKNAGKSKSAKITGKPTVDKQKPKEEVAKKKQRDVASATERLAQARKNLAALQERGPQPSKVLVRILPSGEFAPIQVGDYGRLECAGRVEQILDERTLLVRFESLSREEPRMGGLIRMPTDGLADDARVFWQGEPLIAMETVRYTSVEGEMNTVFVFEPLNMTAVAKAIAERQK